MWGVDGKATWWGERNSGASGLRFVALEGGLEGGLVGRLVIALVGENCCCILASVY